MCDSTGQPPDRLHLLCLSELFLTLGECLFGTFSSGDITVDSIDLGRTIFEVDRNSEDRDIDELSMAILAHRLEPDPLTCDRTLREGLGLLSSVRGYYKPIDMPALSLPGGIPEEPSKLPVDPLNDIIAIEEHDRLRRAIEEAGEIGSLPPQLLLWPSLFSHIPRGEDEDRLTLGIEVLPPMYFEESPAPIGGDETDLGDRLLPLRPGESLPESRLYPLPIIGVDELEW